MTQSVGDRIALVREALQTRREPLPMHRLADMLNAHTGTSAYDAPKLSNIETGKRRARLEDIAAIAAVDPLRRGRLWLGWGDSEGLDALYATPLRIENAHSPATQQRLAEDAAKRAGAKKGKTARKRA